MKHFHFETITSTNDYCKQNYLNLPSLCYVTATHQTQGRGRNQRVWIDQPHNVLALSILIKNPSLPFEQYSMLIALSMVQILKKLAIDASIKWPNDVLINYKKVSGILLEGSHLENQSYIVIGIGVNVNNVEFAPEIQHKATSIFLQSKHTYDIQKIAKMLVKQFYKNIKKSRHHFADLLLLYKQSSCVLNQTIQFEYQNQLETGKVMDILQDGSLIIQTDKKQLNINYGEITLLNYYS